MSKRAIWFPQVTKYLGDCSVDLFLYHITEMYPFLPAGKLDVNAIVGKKPPRHKISGNTVIGFNPDWLIYERNIKNITSSWIVLKNSGRFRIKKGELVHDGVEAYRIKKAKGIERKTRWHAAKVIQNGWRKAISDPSTPLGRKKLMIMST